MKFVISRTSSLLSEGKPCTEANKMAFEKWHTRTCTEEEFNLRFSAREGLWKDKGKNHTVTKDGYISRQEASVLKNGGLNLIRLKRYVILLINIIQ
jgi:hypothetical protein